MIFRYLVPWDPSPTAIIALLVTAILYLRGMEKGNPRWSNSLCFWIGLIALYAVLQTRFDYYSQREFFMHRLQHTILHHIGPFLITFSRPGTILAAGTPQRLKQAVLRLLDYPATTAFIDVINNPVIAVLLFVGLILFWLIPSVHFIAMLDWRWYRVMNWGMAINGLMFWNLVLNNFSFKRYYLTSSTRILMMLAIIPPQIAIGAMISFAPREVFLSYAICGRVFSSLAAVADQQIGGLILWIPAAMMSVIGILTVIQREWLTQR